jgi:hypothetical protein
MIEKEIIMAQGTQSGIYLIVEFEWPKPFEPEYGKKARDLHNIVLGQGWIKEVFAASGGIGQGATSMWVFWLESYTALDRLLREQEDPVSKAYLAFFRDMSSVTDRIREEVRFV